MEANAVESRYSGVLEGWLEDAPDDDHHDEHTLELKHVSFTNYNDLEETVVILSVIPNQSPVAPPVKYLTLQIF